MASLSHEQVAPRRLLWVGPLTIACVVIANLLIRALAVAFLGVSDSFQSLQPPSIIGSSCIFLLLALLIFWLVSRSARRPIRLFRIIALTLLVLSLLTPVMALIGIFPLPGMNMSIFWTMIAMHLVSGAIAIGLLTTLTQQQS
ncbi:hypothetical protein KDH_76260 [Dictyobacter sp. S3.2.2.5]|uniref:Uncharacterized protein n=1 Tax=Dictyobacter halimunensis TaxID=3026934 RepID=A0ABQ6G687_9CHLR|nr:hypothetical protein KDH_76260 [Dictyobacter sp. S3.2.2.5]